MNYLLFFTALALSSVAEYYSIMGLMAIFSGAMISIAVMGCILGLAKIVLVSWVYRNWKETPLLLKSYFVMAIFILMSLTSMGIFGYLSKAHLEQGVVSGDVMAEVALLDEKINIQKENINAARKTISQLDSQVDAALSRTTDAAGADRSTSIRRSQTRERSKLIEDISAAQKEITKLNEERAPKAVELRKVEAEVGPIKYIAALIYEDSTNKDTLEKAVRFIILLIVGVFDPLAVLMFVAYNQSTSRVKSVQSVQITEPEKQTEATNLYDRKERVEVEQDDTNGNGMRDIQMFTEVDVKDSFVLEKTIGKVYQSN
jgi:hypothetical protein